MKPTLRFRIAVPAFLALLLISATPAARGGMLGDVDGSGRIDGMDLILFSAAFGTFEGDARYDAMADFNRTGSVDGHDLAVLANKFGTTQRQEDRIEFRPGQILVRFQPNVSASRVEQILDGEETEVIRFYARSGVHCVAVDGGMPEEVAAARFMLYPEVEYAERNLICHAHFVPNDYYFSYQWNFEQLDMEQAWDVTTGGPEVRVAVLDTGVAYENYQQFRRGEDLSGTSFADPYDFVDGGTHANDEDGHGTHVTGTIAQTTNNNYGSTGIAFNVTIIPIRVLDEEGSGSHSDIAEGLYWAQEHDARIANMSLGGYGASSTLDNAITTTYNRGMLSFASAGNDADDPSWDPNTDGVEYPANHYRVVAVGATRFDKTRAYYSNYGANLDLVAPGGDVRVDQNADGYPDGIVQETYSGNNFDRFYFAWWQGTSMSCPHAAGVAALLVSLGVRDPEQILTIMTDTAEDLGSAGWDQQYGHGLINAQRAVQQAQGGGSGLF